jgi:D-2-hydroxyacid dehydrogenase (NADP+)
MIKRLNILSDFTDSLFLYKVPPEVKKEILSHPQVRKIVFERKNINFHKSEFTIFWGHKIDDKKIKLIKNLKWIHLGTSGHEKINLNLCEKLGIKVSTSKNIISEAVASTVLSFILSFIRQSFYSLVVKDAKNFSRSDFDKRIKHIREPSNCKVLIYGTGAISELLSGWLSLLGFEFRTVSFSVREQTSGKRSYSIISRDDAIKLLSNFDVVVNLLPLRSDTYHYFNSDVFKKFSRSAYYISVGRGKTTDEDDLIQALKSGTISGAALDVFENEPLTKESPLHKVKNLLITPHVAALSQDYWKKQKNLILKNLDNFITGQQLENQVTRDGSSG